MPKLNPLVYREKFSFIVLCDHERPQKLFQGRAKATFCLSFSGCWRYNANWRIQKRKCSVSRQQLYI